MNELLTPDGMLPAVVDVLQDYAEAAAATLTAAAATTGDKLIGWLRQKGDQLFGKVLDKFLKSPEENRDSLEEQLKICLSGLQQNSLQELAELVKEIKPDVTFVAAPMSMETRNSPNSINIQSQGNNNQTNISK
jgi:hypothetical protein